MTKVDVVLSIFLVVALVSLIGGMAVTLKVMETEVKCLHIEMWEGERSRRDHMYYEEKCKEE